MLVSITNGKHRNKQLRNITNISMGRFSIAVIASVNSKYELLHISFQGKIERKGGPSRLKHRGSRIFVNGME